MLQDLAPLACPRCGTTAVPTLAPGSGSHHAKALCGVCGAFLRWVGRAVLAPEKETPPMGGCAQCTVVGVIGKHGVEVRFSQNGVPWTA